MTDFLWFLLAPLNMAVILICAAMLCLHLGRRKYATRFGMATCAVLIVFAVLPIGYFLTKALESRYSSPETMPKNVAGIIVLGGIADTDIGLSRGTPQLGDSSDRLIQFANLATRYPRAKLVFTGGTSSGTGTPEADMALDALKSIGFNPRGRLLTENASTNTYENVKNAKEIANPKDGETWLMVTSAYHMPRAMGAFAANDWIVTPIPTDYRTGGDSAKNSFLENITLSHISIKEILGTIAYGLTGKWKPQPKVTQNQ